MANQENPFTPSFGEIPAHLAGRADIVSGFTRALESSRRRPELTTLLSGARGTGKTTLLSVLASKATELGWITVDTTALPGMLEDIELEVSKRAAHLLEPESGISVSKIGIPQLLDISLEEKATSVSNWRFRMESLLDQLACVDAGLLITVDEVDPSLDEMIRLAAVYQHFVREGRKVALLMAGLPHSISTLLNDKTVSFLRRAQTEHLGRIPDHEVEAALVKTIAENGRAASSAGIAQATKAIGGFPFLIQLIGYRAWDISPCAESVSTEDFERGIDLARKEMRSRILDATYRELSPEDVRFARAMLEDETASRTADIAARLDRSSAQVAQYRKRLIEAGVIGEVRRGVVAFELPYFREYLEEVEELE